MRNEYGIHSPDAFQYLMQGNTVDVATIDDIQEWNDTLNAMRVCGITEQEKRDLFKALAAILWLGNIDFHEQGDKSSPKDPDVLNFVASLLGVPPSFLSNALTIRQMQTQHGRKAGTNYAVPLNRMQALTSRDAVAKALYDRIFDWLIAKVNKALTTGNSAVSIGVLDIYGFEVFQKNGFEQFCINYVNEKLQQVFIELTLKLEQEEYVAEGIQWTPIKFFNNKIVCDLIEEKRPPGIFCVLDDVCKTVSKTNPDNAFAERVNCCNENPHFKHRGKAFTVNHYAGDVTYEISGMVDKNKDTLFKDLLATIKLAENKFVSQVLFPEEVDEDDKKMPTTATFKIKNQAAKLIDTLMKSTPHYVRCIKPNDDKKADYYVKERVMHQIVYLGLLDNLKVRRAGFAYRSGFKKFMDRYYLISKQCSYAAKRTWNGDDISGCKAILADNYIGADQYQIGKTKIFIRHPETLFHLEDLRENYWHNIVDRIKNAYYTWKNFHGECVTRIKVAFRVWKSYRAEMISIIQKAYREYKDLSPFYDRRMDNEQKFHGNKQRNRLSMASVRKFFGDYLDMRNQSVLLQAMGPGASNETVLFSYKAKVVVHPGLLRANKLSPRFLIVTEQYIYLIMLVLKKKVATHELDRKIPLSQVQGVSLSPLFDNFVIVHVPEDHDCVIECDLKTEFVAWLRSKRPNLQVNFAAEIEYMKKKGSKQKITFGQELDAQRVKLKLDNTVTSFYKKNKVLTTAGLPASSTPREFMKKGDGLPVPQKTPPPQVSTPSRGGGMAGGMSRGGGRGGGGRGAGPSSDSGSAPAGGRGAPMGGGPAPAGPGPAGRGGPGGPGGPGPAAGRGGPGGPGPAGPGRGGPAMGGPGRGGPGGPPGRGGGPGMGGPGRGGPAMGGPGRGGPAMRGGPGGPPGRGGPGMGGASMRGGPAAGGRGRGGPGAAPGGGAPPMQQAGPPIVGKCRALYDYTAQEDDELTLKEGDVIDIIQKSGEWWEGMLAGRTGVFPANYVEEC
ncbi:Myosin-1 [Balamuthia mandrillaris]